MNHRFLTFAGALAVMIAIVLLVTAPAATQAGSSRTKSAPAAKKWTLSRTPDGQPDLQGFWTNSTYTPLERPKGVTKEFYTREESAEIEKRAAEQESEQTEPGTTADVHYDFTQFGLDRSQSRHAKLNLRTSMIVDPLNGKIPPLTAEGQKRVAARAAARKEMGGQYDAVQNMPISSRCIIMPGSGPPLLPTTYNNNYQIIQSPGYVMILVEMIHDVRIIPLDGRPHLPQNIRQWMGDSRGHWEGDTLVVETTNMNGKSTEKNGIVDKQALTVFRGSSENMRVTEQFTRVDENNILYKFTIDDPATWATPWTAELPMTKTEGPIFEHACHEGNYGLYNTLVGTRAEEKRAAEEEAKKGLK